MGNIHGTLVPQEIPQEYIDIKNYLKKEYGFARVLWVPARSRYGYFDDDNPPISLETLSIASPSSFIFWIKDSKNDEQLARYGVKYIIVPTDVKGELFVTDRKYDANLRQSVISAIDATNRFMPLHVAGDIAIYKVPLQYSHAYFINQPDALVSMRKKSAVQYEVFLPKQDMDTKLIFSESYNPYWKLSVKGVDLRPTRTPDNLQEYHIPKGLSGAATISYIPQRVVWIMLWVGVCICIVLCILLYRSAFGRKRFGI
jgi:hypothetical protein